MRVETRWKRGLDTSHIPLQTLEWMVGSIAGLLSTSALPIQPCLRVTHFPDDILGNNHMKSSFWGREGILGLRQGT